MSKAPDFFIVGAMKAGTTFLHECMSLNSRIYLPPQKESHYLLLKNQRDFYVPNGGNGFTGIIEKKSEYESLFKAAKLNQKKGDASIHYLVDGDCPANILEYNPEAKIIIVLRDPIKRAKSAYLACKSWGVENSSTMLEALEEELLGKRDNWWYAFRYIHCSEYGKHLKRYMRHLESDNIKIVSFSSLVHETHQTLNNIYDFIEVDRVDGELNFKKTHETLEPVSPVVRGLKQSLMRDSYAKRIMKTLIPHNVRATLKQKALKGFSNFDSVKPTIQDAKIDEILHDMLGSQLSQVRELLGEDFDW